MASRTARRSVGGARGSQPAAGTQTTGSPVAINAFKNRQAVLPHLTTWAQPTTSRATPCGHRRGCRTTGPMRARWRGWGWRPCPAGADVPVAGQYGSGRPTRRPGVALIRCVGGRDPLPSGLDSLPWLAEPSRVPAGPGRRQRALANIHGQLGLSTRPLRNGRATGTGAVVARGGSPGSRPSQPRHRSGERPAASVHPAAPQR
jgi:hypothetical protein